MTFHHQNPIILRLDGVSLESMIHVDDQFEKDILENIADEINSSAIENENSPYDKIIPVFTGKDNWPVQTNIVCWNCDLEFKSRPIFIPGFIRFNPDGHEMGVIGNMCSFNCAEAWIIHNYHDLNMKARYRENLTYLYEIFNEVKIASITPSPSKLTMTKYGGNLSEEEYAKKIKDLSIANLKHALSQRVEKIESKLSVEKSVMAILKPQINSDEAKDLFNALFDD